MSITFRVPGAVLTEREYTVPLVHGDPSRGMIHVFTREVAAPDGVERPYLVFLQGGPGFEASRPATPPSGWMARALADFRVLLLDERGTGRSTPVGPVLPGEAASDQAEYLTHFRADSIVRDLGADPRRARRRPLEPAWTELRRLHVAHLSLVGTRGAAGGADHRWPRTNLEPTRRRHLRGTWQRVREANERFHDRYPGDRDRLREILNRLDAEDLRLPSGDRLTSRRFRQVGMWLGSSSGFERLHQLRAALRLACLPARCAGGLGVGAKSDLRHASRVLICRRAGHVLVGAPPCAGGRCARRSPGRRARVPLDVGRRRWAAGASSGGRAARRAPLAVRCTTSSASPGTTSRWRPRCTSTTSTWNAHSRKRRRDASADCGYGSPTNMPTTACAPTANASWVACSTWSAAGLRLLGATSISLLTYSRVARRFSVCHCSRRPRRALMRKRGHLLHSS